MNMQNIMAQAQKMQKEIMQKKEEINNKSFIGTSEWVEATLNGKKEVLTIKIKKDVQIDDIEALEDMIKIAINKAIAIIDEETSKAMGVYGQSLNGLM